MINIFRATIYKIRHSFLPCFFLIFSVLCLCFSLLFNAGRIVDVVTPAGIRIGFFPAGSMEGVNADTVAMATAQSFNLFAWIAVTVQLAFTYRRDANGGAWRMAISHGKNRIHYEIADYFGQTVWVQGWYFLLSAVTFCVAGTMFSCLTVEFISTSILYWMQNALMIQCFLSVGRVVCALTSSEIAFVTFGFLETAISLIVATSNTKQNPSVFTSIILNWTPMPYWLKLGACHMDLAKILIVSIVTILLSECVLFLFEAKREIR